MLKESQRVAEIEIGFGESVGERGILRAEASKWIP